MTFPDVYWDWSRTIASTVRGTLQQLKNTAGQLAFSRRTSMYSICVMKSNDLQCQGRKGHGEWSASYADGLTVPPGCLRFARNQRGLRMSRKGARSAGGLKTCHSEMLSTTCVTDDANPLGGYFGLVGGMRYMLRIGSRCRNSSGGAFG